MIQNASTSDRLVIFLQASRDAEGVGAHNRGIRCIQEHATGDGQDTSSSGLSNAANSWMFRCKECLKGLLLKLSAPKTLQTDDNPHVDPPMAHSSASQIGSATVGCKRKGTI